MKMVVSKSHTIVAKASAAVGRASAGDVAVYHPPGTILSMEDEEAEDRIAAGVVELVDPDSPDLREGRVSVPLRSGSVAAQGGLRGRELAGAPGEALGAS